MSNQIKNGGDREKIIDEQRKKVGVACVLTLQVTAMVLTLRYSKTTTKYVSSTAVVMAEIVKICICFIVLTWQHGAGILSHLAEEILAKPKDMVLIAAPALLYLLQNNLLFFAMEHLEAAVYQVTYQLKILTTAVCMGLLLGKRLSGQQRVALLLLSAGVALAQFQPQSKTGEQRPESQGLGLMALIVACFTSGFAGVYTEKLLKQTKASLWIRNIQLAIWSIVAGFFGIYTQDRDQLAEGGFFQGYNRTVWCVVLLQAASGIVVALVMKIADNIVKNFAVAMSLLLATLISIPLFGFEPTRYFVVGAALVLLSVHLYTGGSLPGFTGSNARATRPPSPALQNIPHDREIETVAVSAPTTEVTPRQHHGNDLPGGRALGSSCV